MPGPTDPRLLGYDPLTGMSEYFIGSEDGKSFHIDYRQDCETILELNKAKQSMGREYYAGKKDDTGIDMWKVASIPVSVQMKWLVEEGIDILNPEHIDAVKKKLNSNEYRYLKTAEVII